MLLGDVADQLLDQHRLADAGAAEQADLAALRVRGEQVDDLDPGLEDLLRRGQVLDLGRRAVDRPALVVLDLAAVVDRLAEQVEDPAQRRLADRDRDRPAGVEHLVAALEAVGGVHRDRADAVVAEVLLDLADQVDRRSASRSSPPRLDLERRVDLGQLSSKSASTTTPVTDSTLPTFLPLLDPFPLFSAMFPSLDQPSASAPPTTSKNLLRDLRLAGPVHLQGQVADHVLRVLGRASASRSSARPAPRPTTRAAPGRPRGRRTPRTASAAAARARARSPSRPSRAPRRARGRPAPRARGCPRRRPRPAAAAAASGGARTGSAARRSGCRPARPGRAPRRRRRRSRRARSRARR